jgi:hypothetical protein
MLVEDVANPLGRLLEIVSSAEFELDGGKFHHGRKT